MHVPQRIRAGAAAFSLAIGTLGIVAAPANAATFKVLHAFTGADGLLPQGHLFYDYLNKQPLIVGSTQAGGSSSNSAGTVFAYNLSSGAVSDLYSFLGAPMDGSAPYGGVSVDLNKNGPIGQIVGTTASGGANFDGTLYKIATNGTYTNVYTFGQVSNPNDVFSPLDGISPVGTPAQALDGNFYGTTSQGGAGASGTLFRYTPSNGNVTTIYTFGNNPAVIDGSVPLEGLSLGFNGLLYGTTSGGGANGEGSIYSVSTSGTVTTLYSFLGSRDGSNPQCLVAVDQHNNLFGTTPNGGKHGKGVVWELDANKNFTVLHTFNAMNGGTNPNAGLMIGQNGVLYGTTSAGGTSNNGVIFEIDPSSNSYKKLHDFNGTTDGMDPESSLLPAQSGFYGTAIRGGANGYGTLYSIQL